MAKLIFVLICLCFNFSYADDSLSVLINNIKSDFIENENTLKNCLKNRPSRNKKLGCVDSFKFMRKVCSIQNEDNFKKKFKSVNPNYFDRSCKLVSQSDNRINSYFELDEKACVEGFESASDKLKTFNENKDLIVDLGEEKFLYMYEKLSCLDIESFVYFCSYVDGYRTHRLPKSKDDIAGFDRMYFGLSADKICKPQNSDSNALYIMSRDVALAINDQPKVDPKFKLLKSTNMELPLTNPYVKLVEKYRADLKSANSKTHPSCDQIRSQYKKFSCEKYHAYNAEEPVYIKDPRMKNNGTPDNITDEQNSDLNNSAPTN